jgi:phage baseplate assembly protein W
MGIQMSIPFAVLENGAVSVESDPSVQVAQRVNAIVSTEQGGRAMRSNMGLPLSQLLFQTGSTIIAAELATMVDKQLSLFEPGVKAVSVTPNMSEINGGVASIAVNYQPILQGSLARSVADIVTIQVGGTVTEVTPNGTS